MRDSRLDLNPHGSRPFTSRALGKINPHICVTAAMGKLAVLTLCLGSLTLGFGDDRVDSSGLPDVVASEQRFPGKVGDLLHRVEEFKSDGLPLMIRDTFFMTDGKTVVRTAHRLLIDKKTMIVVIDFRASPHHAEHHASITHFIPEGAQLLYSQGDSVSFPEWRVTGTGGRVLASFVRGEDGMITPRTRSMFDADEKERQKRLSED